MPPSSSSPTTDGLCIRILQPDEIALAIDWAAAEGWNPGISDAACFATVDRITAYCSAADFSWPNKRIASEGVTVLDDSAC